MALKIKGTEIKIARGDITELRVDAIVNAANNKLVMGGGVAGAIKRKGGPEIEKEAVKLGPIKIGESVVTGAGKLPAKYVIHAATMGMDFSHTRRKKSSGIPPWAGKTDEVKIRASCRSALELAEKLKLKSIAFPALGCGTGGFPLLAAAKIMAQEVLRHVRYSVSQLKEIILCLYDQEAYDIFNRGVVGYLDYVTQKLSNGPFITVDAIIEVPASPAGGDAGIVLIQRSNPPFGWAIPGGFVDYGESLEDAVRREMREETGLDLEDLRQFHTYSDPSRDPRFHTICAVFLAKGKGNPKAGDDAAGLKIFKLDELEKLDLAFDHGKVLQDYRRHQQGQCPF